MRWKPELLNYKYTQPLHRQVSVIHLMYYSMPEDWESGRSRMGIFRLKILCVLGLAGDRKDESKDNTDSYSPHHYTTSCGELEVQGTSEAGSRMWVSPDWCSWCSWCSWGASVLLWRDTAVTHQVSLLLMLCFPTQKLWGSMKYLSLNAEDHILARYGASRR